MRSSSIEQEFVILMKKKSADDELEDDIEEAFRVFDTNHDGLQKSLTVKNKQIMQGLKTSKWHFIHSG